MREHIKAFLLASSLAFGIPTFVEAEPLERIPSGPQEMRAMRWLRKLDLTEAQRDRIFQIFHDQAPATRELMKRVHRAHEALRQAALSPAFDQVQARGLADAEAQAVSDIALLRAETLSRVAAVLSPKQRDKLALFHSQ